MKPIMSTGARAPASVFEFDEASLPTVYNRAPFGFRHRLQNHPFLSIAALRHLIRRLPPANVRQHRADVRIHDDFYNAHASHPVDRTLDETLDDFEKAGSYVLIKYPEVDREFAEFLAPLWDELGQRVDPLDRGRCEHMSFVFLSPPRAVTPFHLDRMANFHLQIQGEKTIQLWNPNDRIVVSEEDLARVVAEPATFRPPYRPEFERRAVSFDQKPGLGVHHPWGSPHAVTVGESVSISLSMAFRSTAMNRRADAHVVNHSLRKRGLRPPPVGTWPWRDTVKVLAYRGYRLLKKDSG